MYQYGYNDPPKDRKVAVYARVSTEHEAQLSALENQKDWYKPFLAQHPEWHIVRMYVDEGITGTSANKRPQFMQMIQDAKDGEFDLILTREVSRFARNTVDTLQYTRQLKAKGVEVFFINDNIKTFDGDGELRLTIMATLAQDESRKTSIRVKAGQQTSMENGTFYGNGNILGYDRVGKDLVINPEQAKTVRMIFDWYLDGNGMKIIQYKLEQLGRLTATGKTNWHQSNISKILKNSFYCGIMTFHKQYTPNFLEQKKINNFGDIEYTKVKGRHEPIITEEEYNKVQEMLAKRRKEISGLDSGKRIEKGARQPVSVWSKLIECECGHKFCRRAWHKDNAVEMMRYAYQCYAQTRTGTVTTRLHKGLSIEGICKTPMIPEWKLHLMAKYVFQQYVSNTNTILNLAESMLSKHINDEDVVNEDNAEIIEHKQKELEKLIVRLDNLVEMRADGEITREMFKDKSKKINAQIEQLQLELKELSPEEYAELETIESDVDYTDKITVLKYYLEQALDFEHVDIIPDEIIEAFVLKIVVHENSFDWYLRFGSNTPDTPHSLSVNGKRKQSAEVIENSKNSSPTLDNCCSGCNQRMKELEPDLLNKVKHSNFIKVQEFKIELEDAKVFLYAFSTKHRVHKWDSLLINVFL